MKKGAPVQKRPGPVATSLLIFFLWTLACALVLTVLQYDQPKMTGGHPAFVIVYFGGFVVFGLYFNNAKVRRYFNSAFYALGLRSDRGQ